MAEDNSRKRLGRGLAALIGDAEPAAASLRSNPDVRADRKVPIEHLRANPNNPRRNFAEAELAELSRSIQEHGIVQPILVRSVRDPGGMDVNGARFEIIAGERRWRAAQRAGLHEVPVVIREVEDRQALELAIIENVQRSDLNPLEEARGYQQLIDEYAYSQSDLGNVIGKSRSHVANTLRLLKLPEAVQDMVNSGALSAGHARALITASDPMVLAKRIINDGLSVRQTEALSQDKQNSTAEVTGKQVRGLETKSADAAALERRLSDLLGLKVGVGWNADGSGDIRIRYRTIEQLESICRKLGLEN
jgi:ParB family chromosome partitioning protein